MMSFISIKSDELACNELKIIIPGTQTFITRTDITATLQKKEGEIIGRTLKSIQLHELEESISQNPFVEEVNVFSDMNGTISVKIIPREAILRVINQGGNDYYIDKMGYKMPSSLRYAPRVMVANGYIQEGLSEEPDTIQTHLLADLYKTARYIDADSLWNSQIAQLYVNEENDIELIPRVGEQKIIMGSADSLDNKFMKLLTFYQRIIPKVGWGMYKTVNLKFANQLVCEKADSIMMKK